MRLYLVTSVPQFHLSYNSALCSLPPNSVPLSVGLSCFLLLRSFFQLSMERSFDVSDLKFISSLFSVWPQMIKAHSDVKVLNLLQHRYKNLFASKSLQHTEEEEDAS